MEVDVQSPAVSEDMESDSDSSSTNEEEVARARSALQASPTFEAYQNLISVLRKAGNDLLGARDVRKEFARKFPLPPSVWADWADDELTIAASVEDRRVIAEDILSPALGDYVSADLALRLLNFEIERCFAKECTAQRVTNVFHALQANGAALHFLEGAKIWRAYFTFLRNNGATEDEKQMFLAGISKQPLAAGDEQEMDSSDEISKSLAALNLKRPADISDLVTSCSVFEAKILEARGEVSAGLGLGSDLLILRYSTYAGYLAELNPPAAKSVWERCIEECFLNSEPWKMYLRFCREHLTIVDEQQVLTRAVRNVPGDLSFWRELVWKLSRRVENSVVPPDIAASELIGLLQAVHPHVYSSTDWDGAMHLSVAVIACYKLLRGNKEAREPALATLGYVEDGSVQWGHCKFATASICVAENDVERALKHAEDVVMKRPAEVQWWQRYVQLLLRVKPGEDNVRRAFERGTRAMKEIADLDMLGSCWVDYEALEADKCSGLEHAQRLIESCRSGLGGLTPGMSAKPKGREALKGTRQNSAIGANSKKRKKPEPAKRRRKGAIAADVKVEKGVNGKDSVGVLSESKQKEADEVEYELNTVFINNLTYKATEEDLREKFASVGAIKAIRIPRRGDGAAKGIAYVEFADAEGMEGALALHNTPVRGRAVWVRRSKPPRKGIAGKNKLAGKAGTGKKKMQGQGQRGRLALGIGTDAVSRELASPLGETADGDAQMGDADAAGSGSAMDGKEEFKTQDDFRALMFGKKS